jgi:hypothetical protein
MKAETLRVEKMMGNNMKDGKKLRRAAEVKK